MVKHRLSCIPIHIKDVNFPIQKYNMEVNVQNDTDTLMYVTTEDFIINDLETEKPIPQDQIRKIFPANKISKNFIDFLRLRPRISDEIPGEAIHLTCEFDIGSCKENAVFNVVSKCTYGFTNDLVAQEKTLELKKQAWKDEGKNQTDIDFETENWKLLDAKRIFIKDSFDFIIETKGVYSNNEIVNIAFKILILKLNELNDIFDKDEIEIKDSMSTISNCFDIILENQNHTIGKVLEYLLYLKFYETTKLSYCGFDKSHPEHSYCVIRLGYTNPVEKSTIIADFKECINEAIAIFENLKKEFQNFVGL
jgi:DNA-directed RNA polymerase alpha subunit